MFFYGESLRHNVSPLLAGLADSVVYPAFDIGEVIDGRENYDHVREAQNKQYRHEAIHDLAHYVAWSGRGLGSPLQVTGGDVKEYDSQLLADYHAAMFQPARITVVGLGVDHQQFVSEIEEVRR